MGNILTDAFKNYFSHQDTFDVTDIIRFYSEENPAVLRTAVNWRIYSLERAGIIQRVGRGVYRLGKSNIFQAELSDQMKKIARRIKKEFPYTDFCVWELSAMNHFSHHLINFNLLIVDVERDAVNAVYYRLKEKQKNVVNIRKTNDDISDLAGCICIRPLVSHAPILKQGQIPVATLEKILVDWATDKEFFPFQGNEIFSIFNNAFDKYTINKSSMLRYASRKEKRDNIAEIINAVNRQ
jgi:DNA-binding Lrp family transcriptional regulator